MSGNDSSPPPRDPPHVRLNSGQDNILANETFNSPPIELVRPQSSRSLVPPRPQTASSTRPARPPGPGVYTNGPQESAELLLPPSRQRIRRFRDEDSVPGSPIDPSSRRTSWSSENRDSRYGMNPFEDSRAPSRAGSDDDNVVNTQTVSEKYNILPSAGLLLFPEDVEKDDYLHNPDPNEKEKRECDVFTKRGIVNVGGLGLIVVGILVLFIVYPILYDAKDLFPSFFLCRSLWVRTMRLMRIDRTFVQKYTEPPDPCKTDPDCIKGGHQPLLKNIRTGLIDPDTPKSALTKKGADGSTLKLVVCFVMNPNESCE